MHSFLLTRRGEQEYSCWPSLYLDTNFTFFTVKSPSVTQRAVFFFFFKKNAYKKSKSPWPFSPVKLWTSRLKSFFYSNWNQFQVFKIAKFEFKVHCGLWTKCTQLWPLKFDGVLILWCQSKGQPIFSLSCYWQKRNIFFFFRKSPFNRIPLGYDVPFLFHTCQFDLSIILYSKFNIEKSHRLKKPKTKTVSRNVRMLTQLELFVPENIL